MRGFLERLTAAVIFILLLCPQARGAGRALVVDLEMNPPVVLAALLERLKLAGFDPVYEPFCPWLGPQDLDGVAAVVILAGPTPGGPGVGLDPEILAPLERFVREGGILILGPVNGDPGNQVGDHDRRLFNLLLDSLGAPIAIEDDWVLDREHCFRAPLYCSALVQWIFGPDLAGEMGASMAFQRSAPLVVRHGARVWVRSYPTAHLRGNPSRRGPYPLAAEAKCGTGRVLVLSRHVLTVGGGNAKEPESPMLPLPQEESRLEEFLNVLLKSLNPCAGDPGDKAGGAQMEKPATSTRHAAKGSKPAVQHRELRGVAPRGNSRRFERSVPLSPSHLWIVREGVRCGWAHMDKEDAELERLAQGMIVSGMNAFWGVGHPQMLLGLWGSKAERVRLILSWEKLSALLEGTNVKWLLGMNYPGGPARRELPSKVVGAEGKAWNAPSPWDLEFWEKEVVSSARVAAHWSRGHPAVAGLVLDLEMYGRELLFFGNAVDFGDAPFRAFLSYLGEPEGSQAWSVEASRRFAWLRDRELLESYYGFLEKRAERMGRSLREAVHTIRPDWVLGCYMAGILHRWFYKGLLRGLGEPARPVLIFTFQRDVGLDMAELRARGIHAVHVRGLLMGMMMREDYPELFRRSLVEHGGYWLNRLTSLVADKGFLNVEAPVGLTKEEAWNVIRLANQEIRVREHAR